jgi:hypothetical protein
MKIQNSYEIFPIFIYFFQYFFVRKEPIIIILFTDSSFQKSALSDLISIALSTALIRTDNIKAR